MTISTKIIIDDWSYLWIVKKKINFHLISRHRQRQDVNKHSHSIRRILRNENIFLEKEKTIQTTEKEGGKAENEIVKNFKIVKFHYRTFFDYKYNPPSVIFAQMESTKL